jgi:lysophospholipase L1-like esterase
VSATVALVLLLTMRAKPVSGPFIPDSPAETSWLTQPQIESADELTQKGDFAGAIGLYRRALQDSPENTVVMNNLAWLLVACPDAQLRNGAEAVRLAEKACQITQYGRLPPAVGTLGAAYAEAGRFEQAIAMAERAVALVAEADPSSNAALIRDRNKALIELYRAHQTYGEVASLRLPIPEPGMLRWYVRHRSLSHRAQQGGIDLLFLGDSITENWQSQGSNVWSKYFAPRRAANFGISGDITRGLIWRLEHGELDGLHPKVVVILIGTNDSSREEPQAIADNIRQIIQDTKLKCLESKVLLLAILPRSRPEDGPAVMETINKVNAMIARFDDAGKVRFLSIGERFRGSKGELLAGLMPDFLHLSEEGYQEWAEAMKPILKEMLE